ncbi:hypothetical protein DW322_04605 [Rhodococcus rhodnii]|uniref:Uncharacterized protein n=2 Tax=Rhodococcus rhodnii TaxID=38312 RepID=R7WKB9_9NOCA|nr:hypothetical protein [Rhodococcus rhodnii]EOM75730.1 hypothetical protein Rrhod_3002 [Rhodococcus rhodnii LMG 5362]TXG89636.1 hypothetical protein DW322_04605 [Rhodococcus rhodnii]
MTGAVSGLDYLLALGAQAKAGELVLDPDIAVDCAKATAGAIASLQSVHDRMLSQVRLLPLGNFECGHQLAVMLSETTKEFVSRLEEHIACLEAIHDMVGAQVAELLTTDDETSQAVARINAATTDR